MCVITRNNYGTTWNRDEYELCNASNALISNSNTIIDEENTKIECNNGERFSLEEYIKKYLNFDIGEIEEKKNNLTFDDKLSNRLHMLI